jgi:hypothetical protein
MDYFQNHVVTLEEYLKIMRQKAMDREATKQIRESKRKERFLKIKKSRKTLIMLIASKKLAKKELIKQQWANFIATWSSLVVKEVGD